MSTYEISRTYKEFNDKDLIIGGMYLETIQWFNREDLFNSVLFTPTQYRKMGELLRTQNNYPEFMRVFNTHFADNGSSIETTFTDLFSLGNRWAYRKQVSKDIIDNLSNGTGTNLRYFLANTDNVDINSSSRNPWQIEILDILERTLLDNVATEEVISRFINECKIETPSDSIGIVVESNNLILKLNQYGFWEIMETIGFSWRIDEGDAGSVISSEYAATLPEENLINNTPYYSEYPVVVRSKSIYDEMLSIKNTNVAFPVLSFNNVRHSFRYQNPAFFDDTESRSEVITKEWINDLDIFGSISEYSNVDFDSMLTELNDNSVKSIAGIIDQALVSTLNPIHYFLHSSGVLDYGTATNKNLPISHLRMNTSLNQLELLNAGSTTHVDSIHAAYTNFVGDVFSIDAIKIIDDPNVGFTTSNLQRLLIIGDFTLTISGGIEYKDMVLYDPVDKIFIDIDTSAIDMDKYKALIDQSSLEPVPVIKTDSITATKHNYNSISGDLESINSLVVYGLKLPIISNERNIPPFFGLEITSIGDSAPYTYSAAYFDNTDYNDMSDDYKGYLFDGSSYVIQKFGYGLDNNIDYEVDPSDDQSDIETCREILFYTGKGVFYCDLADKKISNTSSISRVLGYKVEPFAMTGLSGEVCNSEIWCNPEKLEYDWRNHSSPYFVSVDDSRYGNMISLTKTDINSNNIYARRMRLWSVSGWGSIGGMFNFPAEYNNVDNVTELNPSSDGSTLIDNSMESDTHDPVTKWTFPKQTKLILVTSENQLMASDNGGKYIAMGNKVHYSYREIELPIGYGQVIMDAYLIKDPSADQANKILFKTAAPF